MADLNASVSRNAAKMYTAPRPPWYQRRGLTSTNPVVGQALPAPRLHKEKLNDRAPELPRSVEGPRTCIHPLRGHEAGQSLTKFDSTVEVVFRQVSRPP